MGSVWGKNIKYSIFGESHGNAIGIVIDGLPSGIKIDMDNIIFQMKRRAPNNSGLSTSRKEEDEIQILSGYFNKYTTGTPLCAIIKNNDQFSSNYDNIKNTPRPGHADFTGSIKYNGYNDYRGGGHFSGRITAPLVFAGAVANEFLETNGVYIGSHILSIAHSTDNVFREEHLNIDFLKRLKNDSFPLVCKEKNEEMKKIIIDAKNNLDSVGGIVEAAIINLPQGIGDPFFDSIESNLSHLLFSIPAVKGVEFGAGFDITKLKGSEANDEFYCSKGEIKTKTNNSGGILGGITNGMPIIFRVAIKPTPSIGKEQNSVDMTTKENVKLQIVGRHDPCIVPRAVPVVEAVAAMTILDFLIPKK